MPSSWQWAFPLKAGCTFRTKASPTPTCYQICAQSPPETCPWFRGRWPRWWSQPPQLCPQTPGTSRPAQSYLALMAAPGSPAHAVLVSSAVPCMHATCAAREGCAWCVAGAVQERTRKFDPKLVSVAMADAGPRTASGKISPTMSQLMGPNDTCAQGRVLHDPLCARQPRLRVLRLSPHESTSDHMARGCWSICLHIWSSMHLEEGAIKRNSRFRSSIHLNRRRRAHTIFHRTTTQGRQHGGPSRAQQGCACLVGANIQQQGRNAGPVLRAAAQERLRAAQGQKRDDDAAHPAQQQRPPPHAVHPSAPPRLPLPIQAGEPQCIHARLVPIHSAARSRWGLSTELPRFIVSPNSNSIQLPLVAPSCEVHCAGNLSVNPLAHAEQCQQVHARQ